MLIFSSLILRRHYQMPLYLANDSDDMDIACYFGQIINSPDRSQADLAAPPGHFADPYSCLAHSLA